MPVYETIYNNFIALIHTLTKTNILPVTTQDTVTVNLQTKRTYNLRPRKSVSYKV